LEQLVLWVLKDSRDLLEVLDLPEHREQLDSQDSLVLPELPDQQAAPELLDL
jgi:hypothetical protein